MSVPHHKHLHLPNIKFGIDGDLSYGANGSVYQLVTKPTTKWLASKPIDNDVFEQKLNQALNKYRNQTFDASKIYKRSVSSNGNPRKHMKNQYTRSIHALYDARTELLQTIFPKLKQCRNFGKDNNDYYLGGYGYYSLIKTLHYYDM